MRLGQRRLLRLRRDPHAVAGAGLGERLARQREGGEAAGADVGDAVDALQRALDQEQRGGVDDGAVALEEIGRDDGVAALARSMRRSAGVMSSTLRATRCSTPDSSCASPCTATSRAPRTSARWRSKIFGQTMTLAEPVSSSIVMKIVPFAVPGRWRIKTRPATVRRGRSGPFTRMNSAQETMPFSLRPLRKKATGWPLSECESAR